MLFETAAKKKKPDAIATWNENDVASEDGTEVSERPGNKVSGENRFWIFRFSNGFCPLSLL